MRLKSIKAFDAENALVDSYTYEYDPASQRTSETQLSDTTPGWVRKFEYDQQRQLTAAYRLASGSTAHDPNYDYGHAFDPIGNRLSTAANGISTAYVPNALNQYTSITTQGQAEAQPAYDDNGNLTNDGSQSYTFDDENRLVNVQRAGVNSVSVYDALCRRIAAKKANGASVTAETRFIYDGWNPVAELNANNLVTRRYTWGLDLSNTPQGAGGVGGLLAMTTNTGAANAATYVYNYDGNGNITSLVKEADQTVAARYEYGPFGEPLHATGVIAAQNPFRFSTKYTDDETGLLYYGYRYYNPSTGRWINRDPAEEKGGLNLYGMVYNNPISYIDLVGLISKAITFYYTQDDTAGPGAANAITAQIQFFNEMLKKCKCSNDYPDIVVRGMPSKNTPRDYPLDLSGKTLQFNGGSDSVRDREVKAFYDVLNADMPFNGYQRVVITGKSAPKFASTGSSGVYKLQGFNVPPPLTVRDQYGRPTGAVAFSGGIAIQVNAALDTLAHEMGHAARYLDNVHPMVLENGLTDSYHSNQLDNLMSYKRSSDVPGKPSQISPDANWCKLMKELAK